jgi:probable HAF family extracellular repeat protein
MRTIIVVLTYFLAVTASSAAPIYTIVDLGGLGGPTSVAYRINSFGTAIGWSQISNGDSHAFRASSGSPLEDLSRVGTSDSFAYGINGSGQIAGIEYSNGPHGMVVDESGVTGLGAGTFALAINDRGQVAGAAGGRAQLYTDGVATDLGILPGGSWSAAYGINNSGDVAGTSDVGSGAFRGFIWTPDSGMTAIGTFGGTSSYSTSINQRGDVVGFASVASGYQHAFVYSSGELTDLGTLGGGSSFAYDINGAGALVGYSWLANGPDPHAFVYSDGVMLDLNSLIPADSGWVVQDAFGINDTGQIVGTGVFQGRDQAFRLDPIDDSQSCFRRANVGSQVPEAAPATLLSLGIVLLAINGAIRTRSVPRK